MTDEPPAIASSGVRGVHWHAHKNRWMGRVGHDIHVGYYDTIEEAAQAVADKRRQLALHEELGLHPKPPETPRAPRSDRWWGGAGRTTPPN